MTEQDDWRLQGQERYLKGVTLLYRAYRPDNPQNDHDHCEFCWAKFMENPGPEILVAGYATLDAKRWICEPCFRDFFDQFGWSVQGEI